MPSLRCYTYCTCINPSPQYPTWFGRGVVRAREYGRRRVCFAAIGWATSTPESHIWDKFSEVGAWFGWATCSIAACLGSFSSGSPNTPPLPNPLTRSEITRKTRARDAPRWRGTRSTLLIGGDWGRWYHELTVQTPAERRRGYRPQLQRARPSPSILSRQRMRVQRLHQALTTVSLFCR